MIRVLLHMLRGHDVSVPDGAGRRMGREMADTWPADWVVFYCRTCEKGWGKPDPLPFSPFLITLVVAVVVVAEVVKR